jgi:hypothetical protein
MTKIDAFIAEIRQRSTFADAAAAAMSGTGGLY